MQKASFWSTKTKLRKCWNSVRHVYGKTEVLSVTHDGGKVLVPSYRETARTLGETHVSTDDLLTGGVIGCQGVQSTLHE